MIVGVFTIVPLSASAAVGDLVPESEYLTFTAETAGSSVTLNFSTGSNLQYNKNNSGWEGYTKGTQIALTSAGDSVRFRGKDTTFNNSNHVSIGGKVACSGNVMSLRLDDNGRDQGLSYRCFNYMFKDCTGLTAAPELPETTLAESCYESMFFGCTNLTAAPELPATALALYCYNAMFSGCGNLTTAPELPATTLDFGCYERMFFRCRSLTTAPELPATTLESGCYSYMFADCSSIKLSETQTAEYSIPYSVPSGGNGTTATDALTNMFVGTGGTFTGGTPEINKTYYMYREVPKLFTGHTVTLGGDIGVNFFLNPDVLDTYTGTKTVKFTVDGKETTVAVPATADTKGYMVTCNVVAAQMAHKISAVVYAGDTALDQTDSYSVQDYAEAVYAKPGDYTTADKADALKALAKAMLNYGSEAQTVFASSLIEHPDRADSNLDEAADYSGVNAAAVTAKIKGTASDLTAIAAQLNAEYYTSSLIYLQNNTLRIYFTPKSKQLGDLDGMGFDGNLSNYYYYKDVEGIAAAELDERKEFKVGNVTFNYSALDYVVAVLNSSMTPAQQNLAKSLFLYNQAANAFFDAAPVHTHTIVSVAEVPATHEAAGTAAHYKCSECEELFTDANGENATTAEALVIPRNKNVNLATLTGNITLLDGDIVTGTLQGNKEISVASGATVTLKDANITCLTDSAYFAGINPVGDATILLEGENTVKGGYEDYPGIFVPENKTLTIDGTGSLTASTGGDDEYRYGCGIGGGYDMAAGNIVINGGTITANGGDNSAGIGSGWEMNCGDITINGGKITANGGEEAAGIGSGWEGSCGDITIAGTVTQVTATKGEHANSIGAGDIGSCGTISIADPSKVTQN